jgi:hypothetical protein
MLAAKATAPRTNASVNGDKGLLEMCFSGPDHLPGNQSRPSLVGPITTGSGSAVVGGATVAPDAGATTDNLLKGIRVALPSTKAHSCPLYV